jgi:potassium efflux system protein
LLESKSEYLDSLIKNYNEVYDALVDLDSAEQQIILLTEHYRKYIDERVLWIRSGKPLTASFQVDRSDAWLFGNRVWFDVATAMWNEIRQRLPLYVAVTAILLALLLKGQRFRQQLREIADTISRPGFYSFAPTLRALLLTAAIAVAGPGLVGLFAWGLYFSTSGDELANAVGYGLCCAVCVWLPFEFARQICRPRGLGDVHFKWSDAAIKTLRRNIRWLVIVGLPLTAVTAAISAGQQSPGRDSLVRCAFIATMIVLALFLRQVLHPERGVFREYLAYHRNGWLDRLRGVWYWLSVAAPLVLAGLAFWGYYYTAQVLTWRLYSTGCFVTAIVLARALLTRWMMLRRRKLSIELARQRASAASQASEASAAAVAAGISTEQEGTDLSALNAQAQSFLATSSFLVVVVGMWWIWVPVLPALGMLDQWELWPKSVAGESLEIQKTPLAAQMAAMTEAGESAVRVNLPDTSDNYVTFADLAFAILMAVITVMCARNVPGLLEISVLQRLPLDASIRYAITSLTSYGIVMIGVVVACSTIGLRWSQVQWLATALTFGLAFGLQEMFANFVAGVIILFERPIRVGDVVTVDDVTGVVSRIRIRATSITNWDRKEYVVPNKEFITGRLLNWTLSDQVNRIVVNVGVAYGSDTEKVQQLLLKVAGENPLILKEPESRATFEGFGDNTLNFVLRTFLPSLENRLDVIHALHTAIDREFRAAGIEIAFPQRDLHIRSMPAPLAAALQEAEAKPSESLVTAADAMQSVKPAPIVLPPAQPWSASVMPDAATK